MDLEALDDRENPYFCQENHSFPFGYERSCCHEDLCNGNITFPYELDNNFNPENLYLTLSVASVIFLTLIAVVLFFSCRLGAR